MGARKQTVPQDLDRATANARRALDLPRLTLDDLATMTGTTRAALDKYRMGHRKMPASVRIRLAAVLDRQARELAALAELLRQDAAASE